MMPAFRSHRFFLAALTLTLWILLAIQGCNAFTLYPENLDELYIYVVKVFERDRFDLNPNLGKVLIYVKSAPPDKRDLFIEESIKAVNYLNDAFKWFGRKYPRYSYLEKLQLTYLIWNKTELPSESEYGVVVRYGKCPGLPYAAGCYDHITRTVYVKYAEADLIAHELAHYLKLGHPKVDGVELPIVDAPWAVGGPMRVEIYDSTLSLYALALIHSYLVGENRSGEISWGFEGSKYLGRITADKMISEGIPLMRAFTHELRLYGGAYIPSKRYNYYDVKMAEELREKGLCGIWNNFCGLEGDWSSVLDGEEHLPRKSPYSSGAIPNSSVVVGFSDLYPGLYRCGWADVMDSMDRGFYEELDCPVSRTPAYVKSDRFYIVTRTPDRDYAEIVLGVPFNETIIYDSPTSRRVFTGRWMVNGSVWPGPYRDIWFYAADEEVLERHSDDMGRALAKAIGLAVLENVTLADLKRVPWMMGAIIIKMRGNTTAQPEYAREYYVEVECDGCGLDSGWYRENATIILPSLGERVEDEVKTVHLGWIDELSGERYGAGENVTVTGPMKLKPLYEKLYLISVEAPPQLRFEGVGWHKRGENVTVKPVEEAVDLGNGTRIKFLGFGGNRSEVSFVVDGPRILNASWVKQYRLEVDSRFLAAPSDWLDAGKQYAIVIDAKPLVFENGTMAEPLGANLTYIGCECGAIEGLTLPHGGEPEYILVNFTAIAPMRLEVGWKVWYMVRLGLPVSLTTAVEEVYGPVAGGWIENGTEITYVAREVVIHENMTRRIFQGWVVNGEVIHSKTLSLVVDKPLNISITYRKQYLAFPKLLAETGELEAPDLVVFEKGGERVESVNGSAVWLDEGAWCVEKAVYLGVEVRASNITISEAGDLPIPAEIRSWKIRVTDLLGVPAPLARVRYLSPAGRVLEVSANLLGEAITPPLPSSGVVEASQIGGSQAEVGETELKTALSPYTIGMTAIACPIAYITRKFARKNTAGSANSSSRSPPGKSGERVGGV